MSSTTLDTAPAPRVNPSPDVVGVLVANHTRFLSFLERRVGHRSIAEEILQNAFVRAIERGDDVRDRESVVAWFYRLLRNALVDHYRRTGTQRRALEALKHESIEASDDEMERTICQCVTELVDTLSPQYAEILRQVDLAGSGVAEAGRALGISPSNAGVRLHRARKALLEQLARSCGTCAKHGCLDCDCGAAP